LKLGWNIPNWLIITLFILAVFGIVCVIIQKNIVPITHKIVKIKQDLDSIEEVKKEQSKLKDEHIEIMKKSFEGDEVLKEEVEEIRAEMSSLHEKVDQIADTLQSLCNKEEQEGMSRAQNRLLEMYKQFYLNSETKTWTRYESEVFNSTLDSYLAHGGNSFIANEVAPKMKLLTVIDE
jgi:uncharacterized protein YydD (DUF2326 family)